MAVALPRSIAAKSLIGEMCGTETLQLPSAILYGCSTTRTQQQQQQRTQHHAGAAKWS